MVLMRTCNDCGLTAEDEEFLKWYAGTRQRYRHSPYCNECRKRRIRDGARKQVHGLSAEDFQAMKEAQEGLCAICGGPPVRDKELCVDHDHETGEIRGLLCVRCNAMLGHAKDDPAVLVAGAHYLSNIQGRY